MLHISEFINQHNAAAQTIDRYAHLLVDDWYTNNIIASAEVMVRKGLTGWAYTTQHPSGNCEWTSPNGQYFKTVCLH